MEYIGIIENFNHGEGFANATIKLSDESVINIKITEKQMDLLQVGQTYFFETNTRVYRENERVVLEKATNVFDYYHGQELLSVLTQFYDSAPCDLKGAIDYIDDIIKNIKNDKIKMIINHIYNNNKEKFIIYPAATKFHHAYIGGLMYHTYRMLLVASKLVEVYDYMNKDLVYGGIILHDIAKVKEFTGAIQSSYSIQGQMLGHIVMGVLEIDRAALANNLEGEEELLLKHIVLSHHGIPEYGSPKKPMIPEAVLINLIDNIDSKLTVLGESLDDCVDGEFTSSIPVVDRAKMYKNTIITP